MVPDGVCLAGLDTVHVVPDGVCLAGLDTAEGGCLLQMFLADDAFFHTLEASLSFLDLFWLMWLRCRWFGRHQHLSQVVAILFTAIAGEVLPFSFLN